MKRWIVIGTVVVVLVVAGYGGYTQLATPEPTPTPIAVPTETVIWATGKILPARRATLSFPVGGTLAGVMAQEGDKVKEGDTLALLNTAPLEVAVSQAKAALALAQAQRDQIASGADIAEIAAVSETVKAALADADSARARLVGAQADVDRARAELSNASAAQGDVTRGPTDRQLQLAKIALDTAKDNLYGAQAQRDTIGGALDRHEARQADYDAAKAAVLAAGDAVRAAEVQYQEVLAGASESERVSASSAVSAARAAVNAAQAQVDALEGQYQAANARAQEATRRLEGLQRGPTAAALRVADAQVEQADVNLHAAQEALDQTRLVAPFDGTVGAVSALVSETVTPGQPIVTLGDLTHLRVETSDLRETDIPRVSTGQPVDVTFDSLPDLTLPAIVDRIAPMASQGQGGTNYTVWVEFKNVDPRVRWGMTAYANIHVEE